jgi:WD40 repeat protein
VAVYAMAAAGYSPKAFVEFLDRLAQTHGKTGTALSDLFGTTKPGEKRMKELQKTMASLPQMCRDIVAAAPTEDFLAWQAEVVAHSGFGKKETLVGLVSRKPLEPPLRTDLRNVRFSPNGDYALAQDDSSIYVFESDPFQFLFRIEAPESHWAQFSPDSKKILFMTQGLRVEEWDIDDEERTSVHEMALQGGCLASTLSHDGKLLACVNYQLDLQLIDVASGNPVLTEKEFFEPRNYGPRGERLRLLVYLYVETGYGGWLRMQFSPDDAYFAATGMDLAAAVDVSSRSKMGLHGELENMLKGNFVFLGGNRILVQNYFDPKNSAVIDFPSGKVLDRVPISPKQSMEAPTKGNYVILRPVKDAEVGLLSLDTKNFVIGSKQTPAMDVYGDDVLMQRKSGELGVFDYVKHQQLGETELPKSSLGTLRAWAVSPDLRWLAASGTSRGAVWDLSSSKRLYYTRGFRGAYFEEDKQIYADFPKQDPLGRGIAKGELAMEQMDQVIPIDEKAAVVQNGPYLLQRKAGKDGVLQRDITLEVADVHTGNVMWTRRFPKEAPSISLYAQRSLLAFVWNVDSAAAKDEIKGDAALKAKFAAMQDHKGAVLMEVVDPMTGNSRGQLLIDTGKGSFRVMRCFAAGDWVLVADNENRTRVYSLSTGEQKALFFGSFGMLSEAAGLLVVENESGQMDVYDLKSLERKNELMFPYRISAWSFSADGKKLFVLTGNQMVYLFDSGELAKGSAAVAGGN